MKKLINYGILMGALLAGGALPLGAQPQPPQPPYAPGGETNNMSRREQWHAMRERMAAEIKAQDEELQQMVTQMNNAPPDQRLDAVTAVVNKLVADRLALHQELEAMHQQMGGTNAPPNQGTNAYPQSP